jgi:hypothetical protein
MMVATTTTSLARAPVRGTEAPPTAKEPNCRSTELSLAPVLFSEEPRAVVQDAEEPPAAVRGATQEQEAL